MKVRISDLPNQGLPLDLALADSLFTERLSEGGQHCDITATGPICFKGVLRPLVDQGAELIGDASIAVNQLCARCIEPKPRRLAVELRMFLKPKPEYIQPGETFEDDIGLSFYNGEYVDLQELILESLILQIDLFWKPEFDGSGNCSLCKQAFAQESTTDHGQNPFKQLKKG